MEKEPLLKQEAFLEKKEKKKVPGIRKFFEERIETITDLAYVSTEEEIDKIEKAGNFITPPEAGIDFDVIKKRALGFNREDSREDKEYHAKLFGIWEGKEEFLKELELIEELLQSAYNSPGDTLAKILTGKRIIEICAGNSIAGLIDRNKYQKQPLLSRALAKYIRENKIDAEIIATDICLQPIIEERFGLKTLREWNNNIPRKFSNESERFDIVILRDWKSSFGAIPIYKSEGIFLCLYPIGQSGPDFSRLEEKGFKKVGYSDDGYAFKAPKKFELEKSLLAKAVNEIITKADQGYFPPEIKVYTAKKPHPPTRDSCGLQTYELFLKERKKETLILTENNQNIAFIHLREGNYPIDLNNKLHYVSEKIPLIYDMSHLGDIKYGSKKESLWRLDLDAGKLDKIIEVEFPRKIKDGTDFVDYEKEHIRDYIKVE